MADFKNIEFPSISKKDKLLLQYAAGFILIVAFVFYILIPEKDKCLQLEAELDTSKATQIAIGSLIGNEQISDGMSITIGTSSEYYDYFYGVLNAYTIDDIISGLASECGLDIKSLSITDYEPVGSETILGYKNNAYKNMAEMGENVDANELGSGVDLPAENEGAATDGELEEELLTVCKVSLNVVGNYNQLLLFIDSLNAKSDCLVIADSTITKDLRAVNGEASCTASFVINIFGIDFSKVEEISGEYSVGSLGISSDDAPDGGDKAETDDSNGAVSELGDESEGVSLEDNGNTVIQGIMIQ